MPDDWPMVGLVGAVGVLLLVTSGVVLSGAFGLGGPDGTASTPTDTATVSQPFVLETRNVDDCGMLCRNVTSTVTNEQSTVARDVTILTRLYAGNDTDGPVRWRRTERVGRIDAGGTYWTTRQVDLSLDDALAIQETGGWVTIRTTVESLGRGVTVTDRREVT